ncbi:MAG: glycoside hydrolase family 2 TIM barrel-domain containing protein [Phycisphaerales bacterium JB052]
MKNAQLLSIFAGCLSLAMPMGCATYEGSRVELVERDGRFMLLKDGVSHTIYGVGGHTDLERLASYGGNTVRTWDAEGIGEMLDEAHALGISVVAGIWLEHQRHGFDYDDAAQRSEELERVEQLVLEHRHHPALLAWGVGNEVELGGDFDVALRQINDAAAIVRRLDPHHPRMAIIAEIGDDKAVRIQNECPDIDLIGINSYGGLASVPERLAEQGYEGAWTVTEWGVVGHWEMGKTPWGAPYEQSSGGKADFLREVYTQAIEPNLGDDCLGSFAFLWGHKQEKTATWYGLLLESGETTERVDVLSELWTGERVSNGAPRVEQIEMLDANPAGVYASEPVRVQVLASEPDGDAMLAAWHVLPESDVQSMGGDFERQLDAVDVAIEQDGELGAMITLPDEPGAYRIFVTVRDGHGHAGTANLPIYVVERDS